MFSSALCFDPTGSRRRSNDALLGPFSTRFRIVHSRKSIESVWETILNSAATLSSSTLRSSHYLRARPSVSVHTTRGAGLSVYGVSCVIMAAIPDAWF